MDCIKINGEYFEIRVLELTNEQYELLFALMEKTRYCYRELIFELDQYNAFGFKNYEEIPYILKFGGFIPSKYATIELLDGKKSLVKASLDKLEKHNFIVDLFNLQFSASELNFRKSRNNVNLYSFRHFKGEFTSVKFTEPNNLDSFKFKQVDTIFSKVKLQLDLLQIDMNSKQLEFNVKNKVNIKNDVYKLL